MFTSSLFENNDGQADKKVVQSLSKEVALIIASQLKKSMPQGLETKKTDKADTIL